MVRFIAITGFLGAGKTTTMLRAAERLRQSGQSVVVVTNDQGSDLVDTATARGQFGPVGEVTGGCLCCRFDDLVETACRLVAEQAADVVIAELVGSCTDAVATVLRPLSRLDAPAFEVSPLTSVVDPFRYLAFERAATRGEADTDLSYLFGKQLEDADLIAVNKADLLPAERLATIVDALAATFPHATVACYSAADGSGMDHLLRLWRDGSGVQERNLDIDYHRYGAAEARLAWLNQTFELTARHWFVPAAWARTALTRIRDLCLEGGHLVGHVKLVVAAIEGATRASLVDADAEVSADQPGPARIRTGRVTLNARVACEPAQLEDLVRSAVAAADAVSGVRSSAPEGRSFKPAQPVPSHRLLAGAGR